MEKADLLVRIQETTENHILFGEQYSLVLKMAREIVSFPIANGDFPVCYVSLPEGNPQSFTHHITHINTYHGRTFDMFMLLVILLMIYHQ